MGKGEIESNVLYGLGLIDSPNITTAYSNKSGQTIQIQLILMITILI